MSAIWLVDGNNLGHVLGHINKTAGRYDTVALLQCLDGVARYLATQQQEVNIVLFLDDVYAAEQLGGWVVQVAPVPNGDADAAIRAYARAHTGHLQLLVSGDRALCDDAAMWGVVCLPPADFVSRYLVPARQAGFHTGGVEIAPDGARDNAGGGPQTPGLAQEPPSFTAVDRGKIERQRQIEALKQTEATLRGEPPAPPKAFKLDLSHWTDSAELALYLAEHHLCRQHPDLTDPDEMIATIVEHCSRQPRYFTSGRVINRLFRLFLCRPEHTLSLDDLVRLAQTRRRKIRAAIVRYGERLGIVAVW
jgi:hypothetical protein